MTEWEADSMYWRGFVPRGEKAHWCLDWDLLPIDEFDLEFDSCSCYEGEDAEED